MTSDVVFSLIVKKKQHFGMVESFVSMFNGGKATYINDESI